MTNDIEGAIAPFLLSDGSGCGSNGSNEVEYTSLGEIESHGDLSLQEGGHGNKSDIEEENPYKPTDDRLHNTEITVRLDNSQDDRSDISDMTDVGFYDGVFSKENLDLTGHGKISATTNGFRTKMEEHFSGIELGPEQAGQFQRLVVAGQKTKESSYKVLHGNGGSLGESHVVDEEDANTLSRADNNSMICSSGYLQKLLPEIELQSDMSQSDMSQSDMSEEHPTFDSRIQDQSGRLLDAVNRTDKSRNELKRMRQEEGEGNGKWENIYRAGKCTKRSSVEI